MIIATTLTLKQYVKFSYAYLYSYPFYIVLTVYGVLMLLSLFFYIPDNSVILFFQIIISTIIVIVVPLRVRRNAEKRFFGNDLVREKKVYEFTGDKIIVTGESFKSEYSWDKMTKVKELKNWLVVFYGKSAGFVIPKADFGDKLDEFRQLVKSKPGVKRKLRG